MLYRIAEPSAENLDQQWRILNPEENCFRAVSFIDGLAALSHRHGRIPSQAPAAPSGSLAAPFGGTKILCVGRNYRPHVRELGNEIPKEPLWFSKPPSSLIGHNGKVLLPKGFGRIDYEGEVAFVIGRSGRNISASEALKFIAGVTLAIDITARELQKTDGQWTRAKGFDTFCPLGPGIASFEQSWLDCSITTTKNGTIVQNDRLSSLIFPVPQLIQHLSACMTLEPGDVILTGTPAGVGPLESGDHLKVEAEGPVHLSLNVTVEAAVFE
ncbi:MAG: fumarylacetoacetate hydrolase family protein [Candidatus Riflebacteria bacterium]|nr:fumarylacetoacetate hydrolase family protein [Candidatus Riflebacteria bacterium]